MDQKKRKILDPFNLESITVHLVMLFDVVLVYETKFTARKSQEVPEVVFTAWKRRGRWSGNSTLGGMGIPQEMSS